MVTASRILGDEVGSTAPAFLAVLAVHVLAGLTAVITGAVAALARKGSPRHVRAGRWYYRAITAVFATAAALAAMRWAQDWYLLVLGATAFTAATAGYLHRRRHRPGDTGHIAGMGIAYTAMLTAFYVDNGPHLLLWDRVPTLAFWLLPPPSPLPSSPVPSGGRGQVWRETANPVPEVGDGRVEAIRIAGRDRVGDRPVDRDLATEFLPGQVAHGDHEVAFVLDRADVAGTEPGPRQAGGAGGGGPRAGAPLRGPAG